MKRLIDDLLEQLEAYQERTNYSLGGTSIPSLCNELQSALESGALDCLVEYCDPPDTDRWVLALVNGERWQRARYQGGCWYGEMTPGGLPYYHYGMTWRELPPVPRVEK